jgi:hypothetical protein
MANPKSNRHAFTSVDFWTVNVWDAIEHRKRSVDGCG